MTEEKTIKQLVLDFLKESGFEWESLYDLELASIKAMGFSAEDRNSYYFVYKEYLHEFTHSLDAIFRSEGDKINLQPPDVSRELGATTINNALCDPLLYNGRILSYQDFFEAISGKLSKAKNYLISKYPTKDEPQYIPLNSCITDEEINEHIKLALIIRGRIRSMYGKEWKEMDYKTEQPNLTISGILPDITVSELKEIPGQLLLDYARDGIAVAIKNGLSEETAKKIDEVAYALYKEDEPSDEIENPKIKTNENFLNS